MKADAHGAELGAIEASLSDPWVKRVAIANSEGQIHQARSIASAIVNGNPDDLLAKTLVAEASMELWDLDEAERLLKSVVERAPGFLRATMLLATCLGKQVRMRDAIALLDEVIVRKPQNVMALSHLGQLLSEVGQNERATVTYERLVSLDENQAKSWVQLAHYYRIVGRRQDSINSLRRALALEPLNGSAWWPLANFFGEQLNSGDEEALNKALNDRHGHPDEGALHLALGLLADRRADYPTAFDHFVAGKRVRLAEQPYDPHPISVAVDGVIKSFTPEFYRRRCPAGSSDCSAIFIIGMPRSGTTLVERILGRHSAIEGAGELRIVDKLAEWVRHQAENPDNYAAMLETMSDAQLRWVGERYVEASADFRKTGKPFFIDKNNLNWMQIGLILIALPNAKIIDVRRNALDCCWANFKMLFSGGFPATNDLRHVGIIYRDYVRLFDAVAMAAPGRILSVQYEDVVDDIETQTRRMLNFLDLDYEPGCIDFHLSEGAVATPSSEQVRQPLNRKGIGSAEPYRQWLGPLVEELGPLTDQPA